MINRASEFPRSIVDRIRLLCLLAGFGLALGAPAAAAEERAPVNTQSRWREAEKALSVSRYTGDLTAHLSHGLLNQQLLTFELEENSPQVATAIARQYEVRNRVLMVTDMSGFTRITKRRGIIHYMSLIKLMQTLCLPVLTDDHGGRLVKTEADDLIIAFDSVERAADAAIAIQQITRDYNQGRSEDDQIKLSIGIAQGDYWLLPGVDAFGGAESWAFQLGEDVADKETLLTARAAETLLKLPGAENRWKVDWREEEVLGEVSRVASLTAASGRDAVQAKPLSVVVSPPVNVKEPQLWAELIWNRAVRVHQGDDGSSLRAIDEEIDELFKRPATILILNTHAAEEGHEELSPLAYLVHVKLVRDKVFPRVTAHGGVLVSSMKQLLRPKAFVVFGDPESAVQAALAIMDDVEKNRMPFRVSAAVASGDILNLDNREVFGDPVNVAFKLAEDLAGADDLFLAPDVYHAVSGSVERPMLKQQTEISGVDFEYWRVDWRKHGD